MGRNDFSNLGEEVKKAVQDALNARNFNQLNADITRTVNSALEEIRQTFGANRNNGFHGYQKTYGGENQAGQNQRKKDHGSGQEPSGGRTGAGQEEKTPQEEKKSSDREWQRSSQGPTTAAYEKNSGKYKIIRNHSGRFEKVLVKEENRNMDSAVQPVREAAFQKPAGLGIPICLTSTGVAGMFLASGMLLWMAVARVEAMGYLASVPLFLISSGAFLAGYVKLKRAGRFRHYFREIKEKGYCTIKDLALGLGKKEGYVIKDLQKMIQLRFFPNGHLDDEKTCFMIDDKTYQIYLDMKKYQEERRNLGQKEEEMGLSREIRSILSEGREYVRKIKEANDRIPGEVFSEKLYRLEAVTKEIFNFIEEHPNQEWDIHRFMEYYLPTVLKLVQAYRDFDSQLIEGENIASAKREIEDTLETINNAFEKLLDSMFEEAAMDVSTDISVLETMLAQEGLLHKDF